MKEQHHNTHQPHVCQVAEKDKEGAQTMMEGVFVKVSLCPDEDM